MAKFSEKSLERLGTCDPRLQDLFLEVVKEYDCCIATGHRGQEEQNEAVKKGLSQTPWPTSKHNAMPSKAVDAAPYFTGIGAVFDDKTQLAHFAGFVKGVAHGMQIRIRCGIDFNDNLKIGDDHFVDGDHFELVEDE